MKDVKYSQRSRSFSVHGFIRTQIEQQYKLPYSVPKGIKHICCQYYGLVTESFISKGDIRCMTDESDKITLAMHHRSWGEAWGTVKIDLNECGIHEWIFGINEMSKSQFRYSKFNIGLGDGCSRWFCIQSNGSIWTKMIGLRHNYFREFHVNDIIKFQLCSNLENIYVRIYKNDVFLDKIFEKELYGKRQEMKMFGIKQRAQLFVEFMSKGNALTLISFKIL